MRWFDIPENDYRASQVCRVLGNPKAYQILVELRERGTATPTELAELLHRRLPTVCCHLRALREVHLVRYTRSGANAVYRIKGPEVLRAMAAMEKLVLATRKMP